MEQQEDRDCDTKNTQTIDQKFRKYVAIKKLTKRLIVQLQVGCPDLQFMTHCGSLVIDLMTIFLKRLFPCDTTVTALVLLLIANFDIT